MVEAGRGSKKRHDVEWSGVTRRFTATAYKSVSFLFLSSFVFFFSTAGIVS